MSIRSLTVTTFLAFSLIIILSADLRAEYDKNKDYHSSHIMINYGLNMIADGSSIIMATEMDMKTTITQEPVDYGNEMIALGKSFVEMALKGPHMVEKHVQKKDVESDMMLATQKLGQLILQAEYSPGILEPDLLKNSETAQNLFFIQLETNNALMMSAQGSNMIMTGQADWSEKYLNRFFIDQGKNMIGRAREVIFGLLHGDVMKNIAKKGLRPAEKELYEYTRKQLLISLDINNILYQMEFD
ncbi:hypothetical protein ACFLZQ_07705 [Thermodesulfobacteriota bacterium]